MIEIENQYFTSIDKELERAYKIANLAREKGYEPVQKVEIPLVGNMAERVEGLISVVAPQIVGTGLPQRINELEKKYGSLDWRVSFVVALEVALEKFCRFKDKVEAMEMGIRVGLAYITMGTVASPLEGFVGMKLKKRADGKDYAALMFSGPIRSAGGTGASVCVLIADYVRMKMGIQAYDPTEDEVERLVVELYDYHERITNLQYLPSEEEIRFLAKNLSVQIDGDPSEDLEVSRFKGLPRIETDTIRNGVCLVLGEGIAQKARKLWKQLSTWGKDFEMDHWGYLEEFLEIQNKARAKGKTESSTKITADFTFIKDLVAGRPVLTHPLRSGGFRLRYGRGRTSGYSACAIHPATMQVLNRYIAIGTQLKMERPGKAASISVVDSIEGPIVKLINGSVVKLETEALAKEHNSQIEEILYLGDILVSYGDFFNRNHILVAPGYCPEWWILEFEKAIVDLFGTLDLEKCAIVTETDAEQLQGILKNPLSNKISFKLAQKISNKLGIPLHPEFTYYWNEASKSEIEGLILWMKQAKYFMEGGELHKIVVPNGSAKRTLEIIGMPHEMVGKEFVVVHRDHAQALTSTLMFCDETSCDESISKIKDASGGLACVEKISKIRIRDKSGIFIGARMGRPEKAKMRKMTGSPQMLFPVGDEGGKMRSLQAALGAGKIKAQMPMYACESCGNRTVFSVCENCESKTKPIYLCKSCGFIETENCTKHGKTNKSPEIEVDIKHLYTKITDKLGMKVAPDMVKGVRGTSNVDHTPEHIGKGLLRAKHGIYVNKDGTTRYDMTQLPITHFKPVEIGTSIEKLRELGYLRDSGGDELKREDQVLELLPQDIILPSSDQSLDEGSDIVLFRVANFVDEALSKLYSLEPFYRLQSPTDLVGHLTVCLAPHTSAAMVGRIIGFSKTQGFYAHPYMHASTRRDCDGDEACVILLMDCLINFSRKYLPAHRGSTQDAPLVLTSHIIPEEVDDMVFDMDISWNYPLEFYNTCLEYKNPAEVKIEQVKNRLNTSKKYDGFGFTHPTTDINRGVRCSAYKTLPSMEDKLKGQMELAEKIRAVDTSDVAKLVIEKHFLKDTKGNLRKFSTQQFRCVDCNEKYRRPPLIGKCRKCGGKILFTVSEGSVVKYLGPSLSLVKKYDLPAYLKQTLELLQRRVEAVFGKEKEKQQGLGQWFG